jgi:hypothetical protein
MLEWREIMLARRVPGSKMMGKPLFDGIVP